METKKWTTGLFITAFTTALLSLGFRTGNGTMVQIWALVSAVVSAGTFILATTIPRYSRENQTTKLFTGMVNLCLAILMFGVIFTLLHKVNGLVADDIKTNGPGQFMASCWSNTSGAITGAKSATISIIEDDVESTLDVESNAPRVIGMIFLIVISYIVLGRGLINSIPQETKAGFIKVISWLIIIAIVTIVGYVLYKIDAWEWITSAFN